MIKYIITILATIGGTLGVFAAKQPDWVKQRPSDPLAYIGIAFCDKSVSDYMEITKQKAISDLLSEIKVEVQTSSLLQTVEKDDKVYTYLSSEITLRNKENLEQLQLTDSWEDNKQYWVYYRLSKLDYEHTISERQKKASRIGYSYWIKGSEALNKGDLFSALDMFTKGIEAIEPYGNLELTYNHEGKDIHVDIELYNAINTLFSGITIKSTPQDVMVQAMQDSNIQVNYSVLKEQTPLANLKLDIDFVKGSGMLQFSNNTNVDGNLIVKIAKITSNLSKQEIQAKINTVAFIRSKNPIIAKHLDWFLQNPPKVSTFIDVEQMMHKAYIRYVGANNEMLIKNVRNLLSNNHFSVVNNPDEANILILLKSAITKGGKVKGEMYDFIEYFTNIEMQIVDVNTSQVYLNYMVSNNRSLAKISTSETSATNAAMKETLRVLDRGLKKELEKININQKNQK